MSSFSFAHARSLRPNVEQHMDMGTTDLTDGSRAGIESPRDGQRPAEYLDDLTATIITGTPMAGGTTDGAGAGRDIDDVVGPFARTAAEMPQTHRAPGGPQVRTSRASMREQLLALFSDGHRLQRPTAVAPFLSAAARADATAEASGVVPSGLETVDVRLAGGFGAGLHLISGKMGVVKTAFLESVGWEAVASHRPVIYYALKEGGEGVRARMVHTLECLGVPGEAFATTVSPWLSLVETIPDSANAVGAFLEDVRRRVHDLGDRHAQPPVLLLDDLDHLLLLTGPRPLVDLLSRLDAALAGAAVAGLVAMTKPYPPTSRLENLPAQTVLALALLPGPPSEAVAYIGLDVRTNRRSGWTGAVPLALDHRTGLLAPRP
ncbi:MAG: hypothetical protein LLG45_12665 [Actinomycetia bacterium]|nr:hypothetical protein [Actinomycetes bacterium]